MSDPKWSLNIQSGEIRVVKEEGDTVEVNFHFTISKDNWDAFLAANVQLGDPHIPIPMGSTSVKVAL